MKNLEANSMLIRLVIYIIIIVANQFPLHAQILKVVPSDSVYVFGKIQAEMIAAEARVINLSNKKQSFVWRRHKHQLPTLWKVSTCVPNKCYAADKEEGNFTLAAQSEGILDQNFFSQGHSGNAYTEIYIYLAQEPLKPLLKVKFVAKIE
jgi:hypothetical protein